jgi:hypothetical protein
VQLKSFQNTLSSTFFDGREFGGINPAAGRGNLFPVLLTSQSSNQDAMEQ